MSHPRFTVICPAYNRSTAIAPTLESVLGQSNGNFDLLVGSDGSTDDTDDVVDGFARADRRVKLLRYPHTGDPGLVRRQLSLGIRDEYVAYIDHDDLWRGDHLAVLGKALDGGSEFVASGATYQQEDGQSTLLRGRNLLWHPDIATLDPYAEPSRVAHRHGLLERAGGWCRAGAGLEDWDLWWRMTCQGAALQPVDEPTAVVSISGSTRRHSLDYTMVTALASTSGENAAVSLLDEWHRNVPADEFTEDFRRWAADIEDDPLTMMPLTGVGSVPDAESHVTGEMSGFSGGTSGAPGATFALGVFPGGKDGWLVGLAAPVVSGSHRRAIGTVLSHRFPGAVAHMRSALARRLQEIQA
ncbi:glycosyltransferase family A protein [Arthrobacter sp. efr-133-TYG-104]|uniref:glycosyltransferase family 2 protein n=1 Tax=Arthrobacter sp. efr-133-TYG-104 TaxID=3040324 RepID=UPI00254D6D25|nr:glycosyltransferase family A protein [Arthrobacter sp. efr-133-TYG-104]